MSPRIDPLGGPVTRLPRLIAIAASLWLFACDDGGDDAQQGASDAGAQSADGAADDPIRGRPDAASEADTGPARDAAEPTPDAAPDAAIGGEIPAAEPLAYSEGDCPTLMAGRNDFPSAGLMRGVDLYVPRDPAGARVLFMWHPLGSNAGQIAQFLGARVASQQRELLIVVPESRRTQTEWGYAGDAAPDLALFDDLLSCLDAQYGIDRQQVFTTGFSAGALWSTYLVTHRAEHLAGAVVLSGGVSPLFAPYMTPAYPLPVLVAWGGPNDNYQNIVNFQTTSQAFRDDLLADGHFVVQCVHTGGHTPPPGVAQWGYDFIDAHTVRDGTSPYAEAGLTDAYPDFCEIAEAAQ